MYIGGRKVSKVWIPPRFRCKTDSADRTGETSKTNLEYQNTSRRETKESRESESSDDDEQERESSPAHLTKDLMLTDTDEETDR